MIYSYRSRSPVGDGQVLGRTWIPIGILSIDTEGVFHSRDQFFVQYVDLVLLRDFLVVISDLFLQDTNAAPHAQSVTLVLESVDYVEIDLDFVGQALTAAGLKAVNQQLIQCQVS